MGDISAVRGRFSTMWQALGGLLPIAVAVAISSVPITVTILILLSPNRSRPHFPFLIGWVIGVVAVIVFSALGASSASHVPRGAGNGDRGTRDHDRRCFDRARRRPAATTLSDLGSRAAALALRGRFIRSLVSFAVGVLLNLRPKGCSSGSLRASPSMRRRSTMPSLLPSSSSTP